MGWLSIGLKFVPIIFAAVSGVEAIMKGPKGKAKQDAAVALSGEFITMLEGAEGKDLLNDAEVESAVRNAIDAVVAVQNTIAAVKQSKAAPVAPAA